MGAIIAKIVGLLTGGMASKVAGAVSGVGTVAALLGAVAWIFGPGREWQVTFNALELSGVVFGGSLAVEWARRVVAPGS